MEPVHSYFTMHLHQPIPTADGGLASGCDFDGNGPRCRKIFVAPGGTSEWIDVGESVDNYNHGTCAAQRRITLCSGCSVCSV